MVRLGVWARLPHGQVRSGAARQHLARVRVSGSTFGDEKQLGLAVRVRVRVSS